MSDFIKVNFKNGEIIQADKSTLTLKKHECYKNGKKYFKYYCYSTNYFLENILECFFVGKTYLNETEYQRIYSECRTTKEEYQRLCKELGVE